MSPLQELGQRLATYNLSLVHRESGVSYAKIHAIAHGKAQDIYVSTQERLRQAMDRIDNKEGDPCS